MIFLIHTLNTDFQAFVDYRIQQLKETMKVDDFNIELDEKVFNRRSALAQTLNDSQKKMLISLIDSIDMLYSYCMDNAYQAGFCEGIKISNSAT